MLPDNLNSIIVGRVDSSSTYVIPFIEDFRHTISYTPHNNEDALRILMERPNTKIYIYKETIDSEPIG